MVEIEEITPKELEIYTTKLVPRLLRLPPYHWTRIDSIAKNDTFVRLNPKYINFINDNANKIPNKRPTRS